MSEKPETRVLRIWMVEDNSADVTLLRLAFSAFNFRCEWTVIPDGERLTSLLADRRSGKNKQTPDLIVLDFNLPRRDGLEIMAELDESRITDSIPVVLFTGCWCRYTEEAASRTGASLCLGKPSELDDWDEVARQMLHVISSKPVPGRSPECCLSQAA